MLWIRGARPSLSVAVFAALLLNVAAGCSHDKDSRRFVSADVTRRIVQPGGGAVREQTVTLTGDPLKQLTAFFPGIDRASVAPEAVAPWIPAVLIKFARADGTSLPIGVNSAYTEWSTGRARHKVKAGFEQFLSNQFVAAP